jgi:hypothetical protein
VNIPHVVLVISIDSFLSGSGFVISKGRSTVSISGLDIRAHFYLITHDMYSSKHKEDETSKV